MQDHYVFGDGYLFDQQSGEWRTTTSEGAPSPRFFTKVAAIGDRFFVWGGFAEAVDDYPVAGSALSDGAIYDPATDSWTPISSEGAPTQTELVDPVYSGGHLMIARAHGERVFVFGGAQTAIYDFASDTWSSADAALAGNGHFTEGGMYVEIDHAVKRRF
jgi:hypothetical protein